MVLLSMCVCVTSVKTNAKFQRAVCLTEVTRHVVVTVGTGSISVKIWSASVSVCYLLKVALLLRSLPGTGTVYATVVKTLLSVVQNCENEKRHTADVHRSVEFDIQAKF